MSVNQYYQIWLSAFKAAEISDEIAQDEFQTWAEDLDGELDNEFTQTDYSVSVAADEAIQELRNY